MENSIDFKQLWNQQKSEIPAITELLKKANQYKKKHLLKIIFANVTLICTVTFILFIWIYFQPEFLSTKIGIILSLVAMFVFLGALNGHFSFLKINSEATNTAYLADLLKLKKKQVFMQTTIINLYFALLSIGICLYMFEYTSRMPFWWGIFSYAIILFWFGLNWFYFRPKVIRKQQKEINNLIENFEALNNQLQEQ